MEHKIPSKTYKEIETFCESNNITDIPKFINKIIKAGFDLEKWGDLNVQSEIVPEPPTIVEQPIIQVVDIPEIQPPIENPPITKTLIIPNQISQPSRSNRVREPKVNVKGRDDDTENQQLTDIYGE